MKKSMRLAVIIWVGLISLVPVAKSHAAKHSALSNRASQPLQLRAISFADHRNGWVAAFTPRQNFMLRTMDGGRHWVRYPVGFETMQMQFINAQQAWAIGWAPACSWPRTPCHGVIAVTTDGGRDWAVQHQAPRCWQMSSLDFANAEDGWAVEGNWSCLQRASQVPVSRVIRTIDGGRTWHGVYTASVASGSVHFGDGLHGWFAAGGIGTNHCSTTVFHTVDGGLRWTRQFHVNGYCSASVDFVNDDIGWLLATNWGVCSMGGCYDNQLYHTDDGGQHWRVEQRARENQMPALWSGPSGFLDSVLFVTPQVGYIPVFEGAGPGQGGVDITQDGGRHWKRKEPFRLQVGSISPVDASEVWAVGDKQGGCAVGAICSALLHSTDAGRHWQMVHTIPTRS